MNQKYIGLVVGGIILAAIAGAIVWGFSSTNTQSDRVDAAKVRLESSSSDSLSAHLDLYFVQKGNYPTDLERLQESIEKPEDLAFLKEVESNLKDLDYTVRGDGEAYKFTYTGLDGETKEVSGNYKEDFK